MSHSIRASYILLAHPGSERCLIRRTAYGFVGQSTVANERRVLRQAAGHIGVRCQGDQPVRLGAATLGVHVQYQVAELEERINRHYRV